MAAFNVARLQVKPGHENDLVRIHSQMFRDGLPDGSEAFLIRPGPKEACIVGQLENRDPLAAARSTMVRMLDCFRHKLENRGDDKGVNDPVVGEIVAQMSAP